MQKFFFFFTIPLFIFQSCKDHGKATISDVRPVAEQVAHLEKVAINPTNHDSLKTVWHRLYNNPTLPTDSVSYTKVTYQLARLYGMRGEDSAAYFVKKALDFIEPTAGNLSEKALVYNGMGNILSMQAKAHEASYYYNRAAAIVLSDSLVELTHEAKSAMLLSAAQSNSRTYQLSLSERMIRQAIPICDFLPEGHINHQRVLVQMIQTLRALKQPADSLAPYLTKLEQLHHRYPAMYNPAYLYESKMFYFEQTNQHDSLLYYQLKKIKMDEAGMLAGTKNATAVHNLYMDYCNIATTYLSLDQISPAQTFLQKASKLKKENTGKLATENDIYYQKSLAALYQKNGRKDEAIALLNNAMHLVETIYQEENSHAVAEMNALYQLQAKDRSIQTLNESIKINELQLQKNRLWLVISLLALGLLALVIFFLYYSLQQRRVRQEREKLVLQQQLLRTQMEPHFIFNTLSALQSFVRLDQKDLAIKYLNRFSRLLRSSLELSREQRVALDEEIETLENYLSLQQMRFDEAFTYEVLFPEDQDLSTVMVPPMLIQPFVENAILHGIDMESGRGRITVEFSLGEDLLHILISDSGKELKDFARPEHRSLSGAISRERLLLLGKKAKLKTTSSFGGGTVVSLRIPIENTHH